jgi:TonB family protein
MRAISSLASVTVHVVVGAAVLFGTSKTGRSNPTRPRRVVVVLPEPRSSHPAVVVGVPTVGNPAIPDVPFIPLPPTLVQVAAPSRASFSTYIPAAVGSSGFESSPGWGGGVLGEERPELLAGPLPAYPDLLRQAGIQGQVLLEALIDSTGRVQVASISVVSATNPGFVEPARQALIATLFRPARVNGRAVSTLVRVPFAFSIRGGTGRAR